MLHISSAPAGQLVVRPSGTLCHFLLDPFRGALDAALGAGETSLTVDLSDVTLLSAAAVATLDEYSTSCAAAGGRLRVTGAQGLVAQVLELLAPELASP